MGLDIYFHKTTRKAWDEYQHLHEDCDREIKQFLDSGGDDDSDEYYDIVGKYEAKVTEEKLTGEQISENFRKVNFLMRFFGYEGNCEYVEIDRNRLVELQSACRLVLEHKDEEISRNTLPTQMGFFWGETVYDDIYYADVKDVLEWLDRILSDLGDDDLVLMYAWW